MYTGNIELQKSLLKVIQHYWKQEIENFQRVFEVHIQSQDTLEPWIEWAEKGWLHNGVDPKEHMFYHLMVLKASIQNLV